MREVELKAVVRDVEDARKRLAKAGASLTFEGALQDRRYDTEDGALADRDEVIRVRSYRSESGTRTLLDWKGPADTKTGYKVREEISTEISDARALMTMLRKLGFELVREIDRRIVQYEIGGATVRFESFPRMDELVEVEGDPGAIERAIELLGMSRGEFTSDALAAFDTRFERRTGVKAAVSDRELGETADR